MEELQRCTTRISCSQPCYWPRKKQHYFLGNPRIFGEINVENKCLKSCVLIPLQIYLRTDKRGSYRVQLRDTLLYTWNVFLSTLRSWFDDRRISARPCPPRHSVGRQSRVCPSRCGLLCLRMNHLPLDTMASKGRHKPPASTPRVQITTWPELRTYVISRPGSDN
jgi:hypothetical protein